jgi:DDE superfamily endonuclease
VVRLACDLPEGAGRELRQWDCAELARPVQQDGIVDAISPQTVQRILAHCRLKPWRLHRWLHPRPPRDAAFGQCVQERADLYTRPLRPSEVVLSLDETTSIQPRPRRRATRPARPGRPGQVAHEYQRAGALHLVAAFDTRRGPVFGLPFRRNRQGESLALVDHRDRTIPAPITPIHLIAANVRVHQGKAVQPWLAQPPRFVPHCTPGHCSWMNQVEPWFGIVQRKRLRHATCRDLAELAATLAQFIAQWKATAHPFRWTPQSFDQILARVEAALPEAA